MSFFSTCLASRSDVIENKQKYVLVLQIADAWRDRPFVVFRTDTPGQ